MDENGKVVIPAQYAAVQPFSDGLAAVTNRIWGGGFSSFVPSSWGFVDRDGKLVLPHKYPYAGSFRNGLALVSENSRRESGKPEGFIDKTGKLSISGNCVGIRGFEDGVAVGRQNKLDRLIDTSGNVLGVDAYDEIGVCENDEYKLLSEGLIPVRKGSHWGFIDKAGNCVIAPQFNQVSHFHEGLAVVVFNGRHIGYIDRSGKIILDENYEDAGSFSDGMAIIANSQGRFVIDKTGKHLFDGTGIESYSEGLFLWEDLSREPEGRHYEYQYP